VRRNSADVFYPSRGNEAGGCFSGWVVVKFAAIGAYATSSLPAEMEKIKTKLRTLDIPAGSATPRISHSRSAEVWHALSSNLTVLPARSANGMNHAFAFAAEAEKGLGKASIN